MSYSRIEAKNAPLLDEEERSVHISDDSDADEYHPMPKPRHAEFGWLKVFAALVHLALIAALVFFMRKNLNYNKYPSLEGATWSPAQALLEYEVSDHHALQSSKQTKYSGPPSPDQDMAWDELLSPTYFAATHEEMTMAEEIVDDSVLKTNKGGYLAALGVYHELHCLRQLRLNLYRDWYYPNTTEKQEKYLKIHLDHCIEALRVVVMCHGNTALYSFEWELPEKKKRPTTRSNSRSVCVKWSSIEDWSRSRTLTEEEDIDNPFRNVTKKH